MRRLIICARFKTQAKNGDTELEKLGTRSLFKAVQNFGHGLGLIATSVQLNKSKLEMEVQEARPGLARTESGPNIK